MKQASTQNKSVSKKKPKAKPKVKAPRASSGNPPGQKYGSPSMANDAHVEPFLEQYQYAITGSTGATVTGIPVNPGDTNLFTRLSTLSACYTEWKISKFKARFIPNGSAYASANQTGEIVMNLQTDFYGAPSATLAQARTKLPGVAGNAWEEVILHVPDRYLSRWRSLRSTDSSYGADARLYDVILEIVVAATPNTSSIGWIELSGFVHFRQAYQAQLLNAPRTNRVYAMKQSNAQSGLGSGVQTALTMTGAVFPYGTLINGIRSLTATTLGFSGGWYMVWASAYCTGTTITAADIAVTGLTGNVFANDIGGSDYGGSTFSVGYCTPTCMAVFNVAEDSNGGSCSISVSLTGTGTLTVLYWQLIILPVG